LIKPVHVKSARLHHIWEAAVLGNFNRPGGCVVMTWHLRVVDAWHRRHIGLHHGVRVHHVVVVHPLTAAVGVLVRLHVHRWVVTCSRAIVHTHWIHSNSLRAKHSVCWSYSVRWSMTSVSSIVGASVIVSHFLFHKVHMPCAINVLNSKSIHLVLFDVVRVLIEWVSKSVDFTLNLLFNLFLRLYVPDLLKLLS